MQLSNLAQNLGGQFIREMFRGLENGGTTALQLASRTLSLRAPSLKRHADAGSPV